MKEGGPKLTNSSKEAEKLKKALVIAGSTGMQDKLGFLTSTLKAHTANEIRGAYESMPEIIEQLDELRKVYVTAAGMVSGGNIWRGIDPIDALSMGLTNILSHGEMFNMSLMRVRHPRERLVKKQARYFFEKEARKQGS
jgi:hypothetical protein